MRNLILLGGLALLPVLAAAQENYPRFPKHNFTLGLGAGVPQADLRTLFDPKVGMNFAYGYRFHRNFQLDAGVDSVFGAAGVRDFVDTELGAQRIRDFQFMVPAGGRAIIPLAQGRLLLFGGGGGAYLRYQEQISQPSDYYRIACPYCTARSGWGYYATVGFQVFFDQYRRFSLTLAPKVYRGHTDGQPLGAVPALRTRDHWVNVMAQFGFSF
ncbi:MAG: hypothetical protein SFV51_09580 [Bryobacteraceae bacterium]|nr:hypothetical protein [Bryobacteraceae bacterium]